MLIIKIGQNNPVHYIRYPVHPARLVKLPPAKTVSSKNLNKAQKKFSTWISVMWEEMQSTQECCYLTTAGSQFHVLLFLRLLYFIWQTFTLHSSNEHMLFTLGFTQTNAMSVILKTNKHTQTITMCYCFGKTSMMYHTVFWILSQSFCAITVML